MSQRIACIIVELEERSAEREFERLLRAVDEFSDRVEAVDPSIAYVGLDGLEPMYGGERAMLDALQDIVAEWQPRIGVGPGKFSAEVAARTRRSLGLSVVPTNTSAFLAPHSVELLPQSPQDVVSEKVLKDLHRLSWHRLGDVAAQKRSVLLERFGHAGERAWELASGIDTRPLRPRLPQERISETLALPEPSVSLVLLRVAVDTLLTRVFAQPRMRGREAGSATLSCELEDAPPWARAFHFRSGVDSSRRAAEIIKPRLESEHPESPVERITVTLANLTGATGQQLTLFPDVRADREQRLLETERQLQARLGGAALHRLVSVAPWHPVPESRTLQVSIDPAARDEIRPVAEARSAEVRDGADGAPLAVLVDGRWSRVTQIEDEWRFDLWWRPTPVARRYYQISQEDGQQLTIYRDERNAQWYRQSA